VKEEDLPRICKLSHRPEISSAKHLALSVGQLQQIIHLTLELFGLLQTVTAVHSDVTAQLVLSFPYKNGECFTDIWNW
jgi:hypothetical protein